MPCNGKALTERRRGARQTARQSEQQTGKRDGAKHGNQREGRAPAEMVADQAAEGNADHGRNRDAGYHERYCTALTFGRSQPTQTVDIPLSQSVNRNRLAAIVALKAGRLLIQPSDAKLSFERGAPRVRKARNGFRIDEAAAVDLLSRALVQRRFPAYALPARLVPAQVTSVGSSVVINRSLFHLTLFKGSKPVRQFRIAVGQTAYPTPPGLLRIVTKQVDPTWYPPDSAWAAGLGPVDPGAGNPLGTRWMGLSAPGVGIHGTPSDASIGYSVSHGCIRMHIPEAEWLFNHVDVGTTVFIVAA